MTLRPQRLPPPLSAKLPCQPHCGISHFLHDITFVCGGAEIGIYFYVASAPQRVRILHIARGETRLRSWFTALRRGGRGSEGDRKGFLDDIITAEHGKMRLEVQKLRKVSPLKARKSVIFKREGITTVTLGAHTCVHAGAEQIILHHPVPSFINGSFLSAIRTPAFVFSIDLLTAAKWKTSVLCQQKKIVFTSRDVGRQQRVSGVRGGGRLRSAAVSLTFKLANAADWPFSSRCTHRQSTVALVCLPGLRMSLTNWCPSPGWIAHLRVLNVATLVVFSLFFPWP